MLDYGLGRTSDMGRVIDMPELLVEAIREYESMDDRKSAAGIALLERVRVAGHTASFFDIHQGMQKLHDAAIAAGNDVNIGRWLNYMWNGIGNWVA